MSGVCAAKEVCKPLGSMFLAAVTPRALGRASRWQDPCRWEEECQHLAAWACLQSARGEEGQGGERMETKGGRKRGKEQLQESWWKGKPDHPPFRVRSWDTARRSCPTHSPPQEGCRNDCGLCHGGLVKLPNIVTSATADWPRDQCPSQGTTFRLEAREATMEIAWHSTVSNQNVLSGC